MARKKREKRCRSCKGTCVCADCKGTGKQRIINSRAKGATFERGFAKQLSSWCGFTCARTPSSGGWNKASGDVTPKSPKEMVRFPFSFELKNREGWVFGSLFKPFNVKSAALGAITTWWRQCADDADRGKKIPILIFTKRGEHNYCMVRGRVFKALGIQPAVTLNLGKFRVFLLDEFLAIPYKVMLERLEANGL